MQQRLLIKKHSENKSECFSYLSYKNTNKIKITIPFLLFLCYT